jgi:hypothetical protein
MKRSGMVRHGERSGTLNGMKRSYVHTVQDKRYETFAKSRSRFKNEILTVSSIKML